MSESDQIQGKEDEDCFGPAEDVYSKLQLLNYEKTLLNNKGLKPLTPSYFAVSTNQTEQFNYFKKYPSQI